ncbi:hypothetical protein K504DRAFT_452125 [Pleomassaria siparia CBS 279.74]|uniref:F-box domain-containing protein n=1 Tax=Pleomassaria siparia CBS 279.74 TaxID=1314801 RepID=A0A6G1JQQ6_9PLEO|nr:hypothetical protein K504DRAFT_452125 [Pleomassaria siparia CBS 279.74]
MFVSNTTTIGNGKLPVELLQTTFSYLDDFFALVRSPTVCRLWPEVSSGNFPMPSKSLSLKPSVELDNDMRHAPQLVFEKCGDIHRGNDNNNNELYPTASSTGLCKDMSHKDRMTHNKYSKDDSNETQKTPNGKRRARDQDQDQDSGPCHSNPLDVPGPNPAPE